MFFKRKGFIERTADIAPDEIFMDSHNSPQFDRSQFEGRIERPIGRMTIRIFGAAIACIALLLLARVFVLQITDGEAYYAQSENNRLDHELLFAERGVIYDRNGVPLAWNEAPFDEATTSDASTTVVAAGHTGVPLRKYIETPGFAHVLGFVTYPQKDASGIYFQDTSIGRDGVEKLYDASIAGSPGKKIVEENALGAIVSESVIDSPEPGEPLYIAIDSRIQGKVYELMTELADSVGFDGGASVILDVGSGEIISLVSMPEFDANVMTEGEDRAAIVAYQTDEATPFLNRAVGGLYTPGSVIKPFTAIGALEEHIISPEKQIYSDGALRVPNPYNPDQPTVFKDWKAHGWVDMRHAIAVSSNVYFMTIGGGFGDQPGIGIKGIEKYTRLFEIGEMTGIDLPGEVEGTIPNEAWKKELFPDDPWRLGDTYNTSIGQYGFQVTPLQMVRAVAAIANGGILVTPHLHMTTEGMPQKRVAVSEETLRIVREGMRLGALEGTAKAINVAYTEMAGKTGTAELGATKANVNSWIIGFWPYEHPRYAFVTVMESGPATNLIGSASVMRKLFDWMHLNTPEYFTE